MFKSKCFQDWWDFLLINFFVILFLALIFFLSGCGTGIGNPTALSTPSEDMGGNESLNFNTPIEEYGTSTAPSQTNGVECGSFAETSTIQEVDEGRNCIRNALTSCQPARYLLDETLSNGNRFVSFVSVEVTNLAPLSCQLRVHTVSNDSSRFIGDKEATCMELASNEIPELACDVVSDTK